VENKTSTLTSEGQDVIHIFLIITTELNCRYSFLVLRIEQTINIRITLKQKQMLTFTIPPVSLDLKSILQEKIDSKTKPPGSLGILEELALRIGLIQNTTTPALLNPHILVFAGDHGIVEEGVSAYPQEVTWQMVMNFIEGGAAINVFCKQHSIALNVIDAGVKYDFADNLPGLIYNKIKKGTNNFLKEPAMSLVDVQRCMNTSADIVKNIYATGCNVIGFGEMGIGNTSSASVIMSLTCNIPIEQCVGRGTGLSDVELTHKIKVLQDALAHHGKPETPEALLATYGGFEIAQIVGGMLQAAQCKMLIMVDGFIASSAYLVAQAIEPTLKEYCFFCHQSQERGHQRMLQYLNVKPLLDMNMRLGEGTGAAIAYPFLQSAVTFLNNMASFKSAGVSEKV
jgi:nicotinate-nucleotide--dimethylbenzimidazole phosphoribosyltransferase